MPTILRRFLLPLVAAALAAACVGASASSGRVRPEPVSALRYEGTVDFEGHYPHPGETRTYRSMQEYWTDRNDNARLEWKTWAEGDSMGQPDTYLLTGEKVYRQSEPDRPWKRLDAVLGDIGRFQIMAGVPWLLDTKDGAVTRDERNRPISVVRPRAHPRLGDVADSILFEYPDGPSFVPERIVLVLWERDHNWRLVQRRVSGKSDVAPKALFAAPKKFEPDVEMNRIDPDPKVISIAPGLSVIDMPDLETRSAVVEFADHLAVIEASTASANGERIVEVAKRHWPTKPIRYFLFSHFHPHYLGGVRAFIAEGATIVTTPGNEKVVRAAASRAFTIEPDRLAKSPREANVRVFSKRIELGDSTNQLVGIDIGERSDHTAEFTIFWLPKQKVVFESEQGWMAVDGKARAIRRTKKFLATLEEEKVTADRFVQSWPMEGAPVSLTRAELDSLLVPKRP